MGTYKVPQNVEAEDKILGPLSMKQFIYALIGLGWGFLTFAILQKVIVLWVLIGIPPTLFLLGLGLYQREDQPMETFIIAIAQFFVSPKVRLWKKEPVAEVFRLEPPPPLPETEIRDPGKVRGQLQQLADVVDTRGWSVKEPALQEPDEVQVVDLSDRIGLDQAAQPAILSDASAVTEADDILNNQSQAAHNLNVLIENTVKSIREEAMANMTATPAQKAAPTSVSGSTTVPSEAILKLATEGGDLKVSQIAAEARRQTEPLAEGQTVSLRHANAPAN